MQNVDMLQPRTGLQYFLTDHLGSVVAVTDASGTLISQQRYLPFGGERTNVGSISQTDYGYTGQRDLDPGMGGLMDYKARFYSPYLNHFIQPDTIVPGMFNPQNLNRFSYVRNNPILYTDPSGHAICMDDGYCGKPSDTAYKNKIIKDIQKDYGITFSGKWSIDNKMKVASAAILTGGKFANASGITSGSDAFREVYGLNDGDTFTFEWVGREQGPCRINGVTCWGHTPGSNHIRIYETYNGIWAGNPYIADTPVSVGLVLHEMGHAFNQRLGSAPMTGLTGELLTRPPIDHGFFAGHYVGQYSRDISQSEIFADMFVGWSLGSWGNSGLGEDRRDYMKDMSTWVLRASQIP